MYCTICGRRADEGTSFCQGCGAALTSAGNLQEDPLSQQYPLCEKESAVRDDERNALLIEHERKRLRGKWRSCLVAGLFIGAVLGVLFGYAGTVYPSGAPLPVPLLVLLSFAAGFLFPFGFSVARDFLVERGVSPAIIWLVVVLFATIVLPSCSLIGIPGIVLMKKRMAGTERTLHER